MREFRRDDDGSVSAQFTAEERSVLVSLAGQVAGLLGVRDSAAGDPALTRLLPDAYRGDADAASEFRRFTEDSLAAHKIQNAAVVTDSLERAAAMLCEAGHPLVTIEIEDCLDLGQEFFRWEIAIATAGSLLGINAFDQPNVQESKDNTNRLLQEARDRGRLPDQKPSLEEGPLLLYAEEATDDIAATLAHFFSQAHPHDYIALQAYWPETPATERSLQGIRMRLRDHLHLAVTVGYGPRFLHSTGQFHKGGPNTGLFVQLTSADPEDVPIPGESYGFGLFRQAQAQGDLDALRKHGRRVLRIHLSDFTKGVPALEEAMQKAMKEAVSCNSA